MDSWPNQEALNKALNIYRTYMRAFIIFYLKKIPGEKVESVVMDSLDKANQYDRADEIERELEQSDRDIKSIIDINDFPHLIHQNWGRVFEKPLKDDKDFRNQLWLIKTRRDKDVAHPPEDDAESESTRVHLFLIAEVLRKINRTDKQCEVEAIRDELFSDDTPERLAETEKRLKTAETENAEYKKALAEAEERLAAVEAEKKEYEEKNTELSEQVDAKEKQRKKLDRQVKNAKTGNNKLKKELASTKKRLEKSEEAHDDDKERLETTSKELKDTKNELTLVQGEKSVSEKRLAFTQNLLITAAIGDQSIFPTLDTNSRVRILDRRNIEKKNYLLNLLEQKQPTLIYVQSEEMVDLLLERVQPEKADLIEKHGEQTSETEEMEILKRLENGESIAVVSDTTFSTMARPHCVEHFVFCHLVPSLDVFFKQCEPAFTSEKNAYLHLIYNTEQDIEGLNQWLTQKYPDAEALGRLYRELKELAETNGNFIKPENVYDAGIYSKLGMAKLGIETGLAIFEELQFLEQNKDGVKFLPDPEKQGLDESKIHCGGEELRRGIAEVQAFQLEQRIKNIWEEIQEKLDVDSEQILRDGDIHEIASKASEVEDNTRSMIGAQQNTAAPIPSDIWPQRGMSAFNTLRQRAAKSFNDANFTQLREEGGGENSDYFPEMESTIFEDEEDYENKYDLAIQFIQEHGVSALEQGIAQLIKDQDNPDYDFTEDETNLLNAFQDALRDSQTQPEKSTEETKKERKESKAPKTKSREKKPPDTTEDSLNEIVRKFVEMRIKASGPKMSWKSIRKELGLQKDHFHKVIRPSKGYREAVIARIKFLKAQEGGWEYSGKLDVLTGIDDLTEEELA